MQYFYGWWVFPIILVYKTFTGRVPSTFTHNLTCPPVLRVLLANTCEGYQGYQILNREGYRKMSVVTSLCV